MTDDKVSGALAEAADSGESSGSWDVGFVGAGSLDCVSGDLPALSQALAISEVAVNQGFEWANEAGVWAKVNEELSEFREASSPEDRKLEFGDVLFSLVNIARWEGIDPEQALLATCRKFRWRWGCMEHMAKERGLALSEMDSDALLDLWRQAKHKEKEEDIDYL